MYTNYFKAIETLIKDGLNDIKTIDWFNNQYERYEDLKAVSLPAVYVEFENPVNWITQGDGLQSANTSITFHLVVNDLGDSPEKMLALANKLHKLLHLNCLMNDNLQLSTKLMRTQSSLENEYDQLKVMVLNYATCLSDYTTDKEEIAKVVRLNLS